MIVNETSRVVRLTILSDASSCGVTYNHHSDDSRAVIMLLEDIYSRGITHGNRNLLSSLFYSTGH
jgi:hypothetical protein